jgi:hypothetical protein
MLDDLKAFIYPPASNWPVQSPFRRSERAARSDSHPHCTIGGHPAIGISFFVLNEFDQYQTPNQMFTGS